MKDSPVTTTAPAEQVVEDILRATRKLHSSGQAVEPRGEARTQDIQYGAEPTYTPVVAVLGERRTLCLRSRENDGHMFLDSTLRPEPCDLFCQSCNPSQIPADMPVPGKRSGWLGRQPSDETSQHAFRRIEIMRG